MTSELVVALNKHARNSKFKRSLQPLLSPLTLRGKRNAKGGIGLINSSKLTRMQLDSTC